MEGVFCSFGYIDTTYLKALFLYTHYYYYTIHTTRRKGTRPIRFGSQNNAAFTKRAEKTLALVAVPFLFYFIFYICALSITRRTLWLRSLRFRRRDDAQRCSTTLMSESSRRR